MIIEFLKSTIGADMEAVDRVMRESLSSDVVLIRQVAEYIVTGGGKRLRPALLLLTAGATGYRGQDHHALAAVIEMIHTATLLHDDVVDESDMRRGHATANARFGNAASVLVGDFLYSRAFQMMVGQGRMRVLEILSEATNVIAEGEVLQLTNTGNSELTEHAYLQVIQRKTAKLFEASARLGAVLGDAPRDREDALADYGMHLGTAFQLVDDILDYSGAADTIGKNLGDDLAEGKMTLPLIRAMSTGNADDAALIRHAIAGGGLTDFAPIVAALERTGALSYARRCAEREVRLAEASVAGLPDSPYRQNLLELTTFAAQRTF
ncbi:MAG TPA: polyprenyl synthetase family protein [Casimicrobiaceae bacterium]|nr:polyprenyl synthetase family protein [Casimicrobiaceae bacterium]